MTVRMQVSSSIGRASVSKTEGCGFESCLACHFVTVNDGSGSCDHEE